jgi:hypothetical protein
MVLYTPAQEGRGACELSTVHRSASGEQTLHVLLGHLCLAVAAGALDSLLQDSAVLLAASALRSAQRSQ